ncbi:MAG: hypothetical protein KAS53_07000 [Candidatus Cloacimonetes bacterium]|nr:hypothetical protein [Candidatus Cloacimonadota bacterium]
MPVITFFAGTIFGAIVSGYIVYRYDRRLIRDKTASDFRTNAFTLFANILTDIQESNGRAGNVIDKHISKTNESITATIYKLSSRKGEELRIAYEKYRNPDKMKSDYSHVKIVPYNMLHSTFKKTKHYKDGINNGTEFAICNIKKVIDLLK